MNFVFATFKNTHIIEIHTVWALIVSAHCTHMVISHQLNKQRATVKALCITWSALLHHQHDYQLHTSVSPQDQRAGNGRDIFISMHQSHCTLSLSWLFPYKYKDTPSPCLTLHALSLPHFGLHSSCPCSIFQIPQKCFTFPLCPHPALPQDQPGLGPCVEPPVSW